MHELADYFNPPDAALFKDHKFKEGSLGNGFLLDNFKEAKIVFIGLDESRNAYQGKFSSDPDQIRKKLYQLSSANFERNICDLGNLKSGKSVNDTYAALTYIGEILSALNKIPLYFGGSQDLLPAISQSIGLEHEVAIIDSKADICEGNDFHSQALLQHIRTKVNNSVGISLLAFQNYLVTKVEMELLNKANIETMRLGNVRNQMPEVEPLLRDADILSIDMTATRFPDYQASEFLSPNGLYGEEICQIAFLSGLSDKMKTIHISEYNSDLDNHYQSAHLIAQTIWHALQGINQRKGDFPNRSLDSYKKIYVSINKPDVDLVFYKNEQNKRFWLEIPTGINEPSIISCSEKDYLQICNNTIPDRISRKIMHYLK